MMLEITEAMKPLIVIPIAAFVLLVAGIVAHQIHQMRDGHGRA